MEKSYYLSDGDVLGGHYEIVKVLGEDEFEILYLVKDTHRLENLFVIKEFFLKAYARRENNIVHVMAKSKLLFEETKKEMIEEIISAQKNNQYNQTKVYGYLEENNTVYTIMEFINDSNVAHYFEESKAQDILPSIKEQVEVEKGAGKEEPIIQKEEKKKSYIFLKILSLSTLIMVGLLYYSWDMIKADKERAKESHVSVVTKKVVYSPPLKDREEEKQEPIKKEEVKAVETKERPFNASYIEEGEQKIDSKDDVFDIPNEEIYVDKEELEVKNNHISLGTQIGGKNSTEKFHRMSVKRFLDKFIASSTNGSIDEIVSQYDSKVDRYFSLKNVNHNNIRNDKVSYQKRWTKRKFRLVAFKILRIYKKGNFDYCDLSTTIQWNVSNDELQTSAGRSKGAMTLKRTYDGFKVTSVYTVK